MYFTYTNWNIFCRKLAENGILSVSAKDILKLSDKGYSKAPFFNLKHDVETAPLKALKLAEIEAQYGHRASYYVRIHLMDENNARIFSKIQELGHEVSYHHEVMDEAEGDLENAISIYQHNIEVFRRFGFEILSICQHGNPASNYENRDFFRSPVVHKYFPEHADVMVNFSTKTSIKHVYISDVGMSFKIVRDPVNSDKQPASTKYTELGNYKNVLNNIRTNINKSYIISTHPHRYDSNILSAMTRSYLFQFCKAVAKLLFIIPGGRQLVFRCTSLINRL